MTLPPQYSCFAPLSDRTNDIQEYPRRDEKDIEVVHREPAAPGQHAIQYAQKNKDDAKEFARYSFLLAFVVFH